MPGIHVRPGLPATKESWTKAPKRSVSVTGKSRTGIASPPTTFVTWPVLRFVCVPSRISAACMRVNSAPKTRRCSTSNARVSDSPMATMPVSRVS